MRNGDRIRGAGDVLFFHIVKVPGSRSLSYAELRRLINSIFKCRSAILVVCFKLNLTHNKSGVSNFEDAFRIQISFFPGMGARETTLNNPKRSLAKRSPLKAWLNGRP